MKDYPSFRYRILVMLKTNINLSVIKYGLIVAIALLFALPGMGADIGENPVYREAIEKFNDRDWEGAHRLFKRLQEDYPNEPAVLNNLAVIAVNQNQHGLAIELLEHAISSHPTLSVSYRNLQSLYNYQVAQEYKKALSLDSLKLTSPELRFIGIPQPSEDVAVEEVSAAELVLAEKTIEKPLVEEARSESSDTDKDQIAERLKRWADAWSRQDLDDYFDSYIKDYRPRSGTAHSRWRKLREARIVNPEFINVRISNLSVKKQDDNNATLTFKQHYQSNLLSSVVVKRLEFHKTEAGWKIKSERVIRSS